MVCVGVYHVREGENKTTNSYTSSLCLSLTHSLMTCRRSRVNERHFTLSDRTHKTAEQSSITHTLICTNTHTNVHAARPLCDKCACKCEQELSQSTCDANSKSRPSVCAAVQLQSLFLEAVHHEFDNILVKSILFLSNCISQSLKSFAICAEYGKQDVLPFRLKGLGSVAL